MIVYRDIKEFDGEHSVVALGTFDGLHLGHAALIERTVNLAQSLGARSLAMAFDRHPLALLNPDQAPAALLTPDKKRALFEGMGLDGLIEQPFTPEFAHLTPDEFAERLVKALRPKAVVVGYNYSFGRYGRGNADLLTELGLKLGFQVAVVGPVCVDGLPVSSTRIRNLLNEGDVAAAARLLGRPISHSPE